MSTKKLQILDSLGFVSYNKQSLTDEQKAQARENVGITEKVGAVSLEWDGNTEGLPQIPYRDFYRISDITPTMKDFENGCTVTVLLYSSGEISTVEFGSDDIVYDNRYSLGADCIHPNMAPFFLVFLEDFSVSTYAPVSEKGLYFLNQSTGSCCLGLTINGEEIINEQYIPNTIARTSDIPTPVQPNWEQNDATASDYIKGKTHYDIITTTVIYDMEASGDELNVGMNQLDVYHELILGQVYNVFINGLLYECIAETDPDSGNPYLLIVEDHDTYGTIKFYWDMNNAFAFPAICNHVYFSSYVPTFAVEKSERHLKQLDEVFIPNTIARVEDITWESLPDKPFETIPGTVLCDEYFFVADENNNNFVLNENCECSLGDGDEICVNYDGDEYTLTGVKVLMDIIFEDSELPFTIAYNLSDNSLKMDVRADIYGEEHGVIVTTPPVITRLNSDYIAYDIARVSDIEAPKNYIILNDVNTGTPYKIEIRDGNLVSSPLTAETEETESTT